MTYNVLIENGAILSRSSVQRVTNLELEIDEYRKTFTEFDEALNARLKHDDVIFDGEKPDMAHWADMENDEIFIEEFQRNYSNPDIKDEDEEMDSYLNMEVALPRDTDGPEFAKITKRLHDANGVPIGEANSNPILDTRVYEVEGILMVTKLLCLLMK